MSHLKFMLGKRGISTYFDFLDISSKRETKHSAEDLTLIPLFDGGAFLKDSISF